MKIGYARVSTEDQNLDLQVSALESAGAERIFNDKMSGTRTDRPGLQEALSHARAGDTFMVWELDRLGRGVKGLVDLVGDLEKQGWISRASPIPSTPPPQRAGSFSTPWPRWRKWNGNSSRSAPERAWSLPGRRARLEAASVS